ncbi:MAG TPA: magnesium transporter [Coriobacteriia bacterium]|jgi:Mg2+ transporter MgtE
MLYLSRMLGKPVVDATGEEIGTVYDIAIATGEIFPRVTALAFLGPGKTPFMLSWRKYVEAFDDERITLNAARDALRFSYLQPDEVLLHRDLLNKQIVDTQGMKVVRVNDLKLSESKNQLRLLGAEVGVRGVLRGISPALESAVGWLAARLGAPLGENLIAWNYMDLLDRDLGHVKLSVTHKRLHELHPADVADILERLNPTQRGNVFDHLDNALAAEAISEMEDEYQADVVGDLTNQRASDILELMDPDDAADIIGDLPYDTAERLLRLMGLKEQRAIRKLLGYKDKTAGGIMTPEFTTVTEEMTAEQVIEHLRSEAAESETIYYIYVIDDDGTLAGVISLRDLILARADTKVEAIVERDVMSVDVDDDQEKVADLMSKYDLLAVPVVDETGKILGIVTVDDALDVMEQESAEDLALATGARRRFDTSGVWSWIGHRSSWLTVWIVLGIAGALVLRAFAGLLSTFVVAAFFIPLVLRLSEEIANHALGVLIEGDETPVSFARRLGLDAIVGLGLGIVSGLIALAVLQGVREPLASSLAVAAALALTIFAMTLVSATFPALLRRAEGDGWRASSSLVTTAMAAAGVAVYLGLALVLVRAAGS